MGKGGGHERGASTRPAVSRGGRLPVGCFWAEDTSTSVLAMRLPSQLSNSTACSGSSRLNARLCDACASWQCEYGTAHVRMSHDAHVEEPRHPYAYVYVYTSVYMQYVYNLPELGAAEVCHAAHVKSSCHTCKCVCVHICVLHLHELGAAEMCWHAHSVMVIHLAVTRRIPAH